MVRKFVIVWLTLMSLSYAGEYEAMGIIKDIRGDSITIYVKSDDCYGLYQFLLKEKVNLKTKSLIRFKASGNPCREEKVFFLGIVRKKEATERDEP